MDHFLEVLLLVSSAFLIGAWFGHSAAGRALGRLEADLVRLRELRVRVLVDEGAPCALLDTTVGELEQLQARK